jgi:hypothetical protein
MGFSPVATAPATRQDDDDDNNDDDGKQEHSSAPGQTTTTTTTTTQKNTTIINEQPKETSSPSSSEPPLCKHWAKFKECLYHSRGKCKFSHPDSIVPKSIQRHRTQGGRLQTRNDARVAQFRHFMATQLSASNNNNNSITNTPITINTAFEGARVLDVAGGKGELAYQLIHLCGVESCHVVDPRSLSLGRFQQRRQRGFYHRSIFLHPEIVSQRDDEEQDVGHLRCLFTADLWKMHGDDKQEINFRESNGRATEAWTWPPPRGEGNKCSCSGRNYPTLSASSADEDSCCDDHHDDNDDNDRDDEVDPSHPQTRFPTFDVASSITQSATLIVGMHPDQAVGAIVDAALHLNISFFVVPCCTYSAEFPQRKTVPLGDRTVKTYDELLDYLQAKSEHIQRATLPFEGKNICLFRVVE